MAGELVPIGQKFEHVDVEIVPDSVGPIGVREPLFLERGPVRPALGQLIVSHESNLAMITRGGLATRKEHEV